MAPRRKTPARRGARRKATVGKKKLLIVLSCILLVLVASGIKFYRGGADTPRLAQLPTFPGQNGSREWPAIIARVERVLDAETLVVEYGGRKERVRLRGIEPVPARAAEAEDYFTRTLVDRQVIMEYDPQEPFDRQGRRLAFVFSSGTNINVEVVKRGFSTPRGGGKYEADLREAARATGAGTM